MGVRDDGVHVDVEYEVVTVISLKQVTATSEPESHIAMYDVHLREGHRSYHACDFVSGINYPEITRARFDHIAKTSGHLPATVRREIQETIGKLEQHGTAMGMTGGKPHTSGEAPFKPHHNPRHHQATPPQQHHYHPHHHQAVHQGGGTVSGFVGMGYQAPAYIPQDYTLSASTAAQTQQQQRQFELSDRSAPGSRRGRRSETHMGVAAVSHSGSDGGDGDGSGGGEAALTMDGDEVGLVGVDELEEDGPEAKAANFAKFVLSTSSQSSFTAL